ncbi:MAG: poly(3-hydroxyalkanoate) depolymerase [Acidobacteria bacterium]|nr:poly(3-hydroxyalkanoate) depolymerase [Acidobacteriota bacterium]
MKSEEAALQIRTVDVGAQRLRIAVRFGIGEGPPLLLCNGIGASLELVEPLVAALDGIETIAFDVPGVGGSPRPSLPYRFWNLACLVDRLLDQLGYREVDVLGVSWGGGLAQQFALQYPSRCRKLILAATSAGALMIPGRPSVIRKLLTPRRYFDASYLARIAPEIYGGEYRHNPDLARSNAQEHQARKPNWLGYYYQVFAALGWTSLPWLPLLRQPTLVLAGSDDPISPVINARILASLIPQAQLHVVNSGHLFLVTRAQEIAPVIKQFLLPTPAGQNPNLIS